MTPLRKEFASREEMAGYLREVFPQAEGELSGTPGGRAAAEIALSRINLRRYAGSRNFLDGADTAFHVHPARATVAGRSAASGDGKGARSREDPQVRSGTGLAGLLATGVGSHRRRIWKDQEPYKTGWAADRYAREFPADLDGARTGLACMDGFARELKETGYLHNHARMWMAAYLVHWRRVRWQAGARWFLRHLLDGDPASNNLSWQWVASTFSHKPYFFNRENLERYTGGRYCRDCASRSECPFDASYSTLESRLFAIREGAE